MFWPFDKKRRRNRKNAQHDYTSLGNLLIKSGMIDGIQLERALSFQDENPEVMLGEALVKLGFIDRGVIEALLVTQGAKREKLDIIDVIKFATDSTKNLVQSHGEVRLAALRLNGKPARVKQ